MPTSEQIIEDVVNTEYKYGFVTDIETESAPPGLNEDVIRLISRRKNEPEFMLEWRLSSRTTDSQRDTLMLTHWKKVWRSMVED